ncbi:MAG TPA: aminotransferase class I/II-fold pyridoxal phosphate-dependent enzyme [Candidatus Bathyarchaeia archaeon]|nr:aminotransferase class I/II-fold pyridoxal phosphate-dependent enzyme [Candidatus Bathyarchaeia archaeon]
MLVSRKAQRFTESVIREMTRLCRQHDAVNLAQGFPDFPAPKEVKDAACRAIEADVNQYAITWGAKSLRDAIAAKTERLYGVSVDPEREIAVTCGATEAMIASILALVDPGDEVIVFEPFYENYGPDAILAGATPRFVPLRPPDWRFDPEELAAAFSDKTRAIILNTPNNPTGKVFTREELETIAQLCRKWDVIALSDEIYEHILYDGARHVPIATLPGMSDRTVTINALSKTYSVTGWRVGWTIASPPLTGAIRKVHDFLTVGAAAPLQEAGAAALALPDLYYAKLAHDYRARRDLLLDGLRGVGFKCEAPKGAYYILADAESLGCRDDVAFARRLVEDAGVGPVPGSSFFSRPELGRTLVRFAFPKREETLREAVSRLERTLAH